MTRNLIHIAIMIFAIVGCSNHEKTIQSANEKLDFQIVLPSYIPSSLELSRANLDETILLLSYQNEDGTQYVEFIQDNLSNPLNIKALKNYIYDGEDPYQYVPFKSYLIIGDFVGEYKEIPHLNAFHYQFIPLMSQSYNEYQVYYSIYIVGLDVEEFHLIIESLK
ncbi:hypothetical protein [Bacillus alkalicellulosilyticus]|uniref:hypothetical protein n=1 Tax=Alkalihalobacterium alkalicellulosilyticum TaxID=1912214 RepID=UPI000996BE4F|nr:hypothetical protein [Bacillus alkalicellulosilyticus]